MWLTVEDPSAEKRQQMRIRTLETIKLVRVPVWRDVGP
jgi:hypothetical protein